MKKYILTAIFALLLALGFNAWGSLPASADTTSTLNRADIHELIVRVHVVEDLTDRGVISTADGSSETEKILDRASSLLGKPVSVEDLQNYEGLNLLNSVGLVFSILGGVAVAVGFAYGFSFLSPETLDVLLFILGAAFAFGAAPIAAFVPQMDVAVFLRGTIQFLGGALGTAAVLRFGSRNQLKNSPIVYAILTTLYATLTLTLGFPLFGAATAIAAGTMMIYMLEDEEALDRLSYPMLVALFIGIPFAVGGFLVYAYLPESTIAIFAGGFSWVGSLALMGGLIGWSTKWELTKQSGSRATYLYWPLQLITCVAFTGLFAAGIWLHLAGLTAVIAFGISAFVFTKYLELSEQLKDLWLRIIGGGVVLIGIGLVFVSVVGTLLR